MRVVRKTCERAQRTREMKGETDLAESSEKMREREGRQTWQRAQKWGKGSRVGIQLSDR